MTSMESTSNSPPENISGEEMLIRLNDEKAVLYLPVIVYMIVLMVVGTLGNILVCCVYCNKSSKTSSHFFILTLAVLDLLTCIVGMPTEVADLRYPYMFYAPAACKLLRFSESISIIGSSFILIAVAFDRYYRICKLGRHCSVRTAKNICIVAVSVGILTSWPACILFGKKTVDVGLEGIMGVDCSTDDMVRNTVYPMIYYGFLFLLFISCTIFFTVLYSSIGMEIYKRKKIKIGEKLPESQQGRNRILTNTSSSDQTTDPISTDMSSDQPEDVIVKKNKKNKSRDSENLETPKGKSGGNQMRVTRTTVVLFAVTVAYVISFLPFLIVMVIRSIKKDLESNLSPAEEVVYKFCVKSYFINNAINPVIYSFLNVNFRKDAKSILQKCCFACCWCRKNEF